MPSNKSSRQRIQAIRKRPRKDRQARGPGPNTPELNAPETPQNQAQKDLQDVQQTKSDLAELVPYNPRLLNRSRTQLQLGDWEKLADLDVHELEHNPAAAELRLLAAAGCLQKGGDQAKARARTLMKSAIDAGLDRESVARILIGGASNTLGRIAALSDRSDDKVMHHFRSAIALAVPDADAELLLQPTATRQLVQLARASGSAALMDMAQRTALSLPLDDAPPKEADTQPEAADENAQIISPAHDTPSIPLKLTIDGQVYKTQLQPNHPEAFSLEGDELVYDLPGNTPGYLVTSQGGDFEKPSNLHSIKLKPNTAYELSGHIPLRGDQNPIFWFFEYANGKRSASASFPTKDGAFTAHIRTTANPESINFGIRLGGKGRLDVNGLQLQLRSGADVEITQTLQSQLKQLGSNLEAALKKNQEARSQQNLSQLESFMRLQNYLGSDFVLPEMHGWAVSPDFGVLLINLLEAKAYDLVIEFGSGVSTAIVARILQKQKQRKPDQHTVFVSFDHLEQYFNQTRQQLTTAGVLDHVQLELAPLVDFTTADKRVFQYYDCAPALKAAAAKLNTQQPRVLVLVDGPPAATGELARYPALPAVLSALPEQATVDFLLDDYIRQDERNIVAAWEQDLTRQQRPHSKTEYTKMQKQACLLRIEPNSA